MIIYLYKPRMIYRGGDIELEHLENIAVTKIYETSLFNSVSNPAFTMPCK